MSTTHHLKPNAPSVVSWTCPNDGSMRFLGSDASKAAPPVAIDILSENNQHALFKLRVLVMLKASRGNTSFYVFFHPEHICRVQVNYELSIVPEPVTAALVRNGYCLSATDIACLQFELEQPPSAIGPRAIPHDAKPKSEHTLAALWSIACASTFSVYVPRSFINAEAQLDGLCEAVTSSRLTSIPGASSLDPLYSGKGGVELLPRDDVAESPPSYDELAGPSPPRFRSKGSPARNIDSSRKRARRSSPSPTASPDPVEKMYERLRADMRKEMQDELQRRDEELRCRDEQWSMKLQALREEMDKKVNDLRAEHVERLEELEQLIDDRTEQLREELMDETSDVVDLRIDESITGFKDELRQYVAEEMKDAEDRITADIEKRDVSLVFH